MGFLFTIILYVVSMTNTVTGTVTDSREGDRLIMVEVSSSIDQTYTNINGEYTIKYAENDSITFRYVGYNSVTVCAENCKDVTLSY